MMAAGSSEARSASSSATRNESRTSARRRSVTSTKAPTAPRDRPCSSNSGAVYSSRRTMRPSSCTMSSSRSLMARPSRAATCSGSSSPDSSRPFMSRTRKPVGRSLSGAVIEAFCPGASPSVVAKAGFTWTVRHSGSSAMPMPTGITASSVSSSVTRSRSSRLARARRSSLVRRTRASSRAAPTRAISSRAPNGFSR